MLTHSDKTGWHFRKIQTYIPLGLPKEGGKKKEKFHLSSKFGALGPEALSCEIVTFKILNKIQIARVESSSRRRTF